MNINFNIKQYALHTFPQLIYHHPVGFVSAPARQSHPQTIVCDSFIVHVKVLIVTTCP